MRSSASGDALRPSATAPARPANFLFDGRAVAFLPADSIGSALLRAGIVALGRSLTGEGRGLHCGVGICNECLVEVDGQPGQRACMTPPRPGVIVTPGRR